MRREPGNPPKQQTTRSAWFCIVIIPTEKLAPKKFQATYSVPSCPLELYWRPWA